MHLVPLTAAGLPGAQRILPVDIPAPKLVPVTIQVLPMAEQIALVLPLRRTLMHHVPSTASVVGVLAAMVLKLTLSLLMLRMVA